MHPIFSWLMHRKAHELVNKTLLPEASALFKRLSGDEEGFFTALNGLVTALYSGLGDNAQIVVGLIGAWKLETIREKFPRASIPVIAFLVAYFGALEQETRGKPQASVADIEAAAARVAEEARHSGSRLNNFFARAKQARAQPESQPKTIGVESAPGVDMNLNNGLKEKLLKSVGATALFGDHLEDVMQRIAGYIVFVSVLAIINIVAMMGVYMWGNPTVIASAVTASSIIWVACPYAIWLFIRGFLREKAEASAAASTNPDEKAGNGFVELVGIAAADMLAAGGSTIVVAALCIAASIASFNWTYMWTSFLAMGIAYLTWSVANSAFDKVVKDGPRNRVMRTFSLIGMIFTFVAAYPLVNELFNGTYYAPAASLVAILVAYAGGVLGIRAATSKPEEGVLKLIQEENKRADYRFARYLLIGGVVTLVIIAAFNAFSPSARAGSCSATVVKFANVVSAEDCTSFVDDPSGVDELTLSLCMQAQECGALATAATPPARTTSIWSSWSWEKMAWAGAGLLFIFFIIVGAKASADETKEKKDGSHGAKKPH